MMMANAILIGVNNYGGNDDLQGCINDVDNMSKLIHSCNPETKVVKLIDDQASRTSLYEYVELIYKQDLHRKFLLIYFSGHGSQIVDYSIPSQSDLFDEVICFSGFSPLNADTFITDDEFVRLSKDYSDRLDIMFVFDCCHSGFDSLTLINDGKIGSFKYDHSMARNKYIENSQQAKRSSDRGYRSHIGKFGSDILPHNSAAISACHESRPALEVEVDELICGQFTYYFVKSISENPHYTLDEVVADVKKLMNFDQLPEAAGSARLRRDTFLKLFR